MDFCNQPLSQIFSLTSNGFLICTGLNYKSLFKRPIQSQSIFNQIVNTFGALSAKSQQLKQVITTFFKFSGTDQRLYIKMDEKQNKVMGFMRSGEKNLFYRDYIGSIKEMRPTCVLDIYVHESCQRSGIGKELFQKFLETQQVRPQKLAYDRPSHKLISFLRKHYKLQKFIPQNNNFVIFDDYFTIQKSSLNRQLPPIRLQRMNNMENKGMNSGFGSIDKFRDMEKREDGKVKDSLEMLQRQIQSMKNGVMRTVLDDKRHKSLAYRTPWAVKQNTVQFYTNGRQYGSYYTQY